MLNAMSKSENIFLSKKPVNNGIKSVQATDQTGKKKACAKSKGKKCNIDR